MRAALALMVMLPEMASAAPCSWIDIDLPTLRTHNRLAVVQRKYTCPPDATGTMTLEMKARRPDARVQNEEFKVEPRGKWVRTYKLLEKLYPNHICPKQAPKGARTRLEGRGGEEKMIYTVPVDVKITGRGDMKPLSWKSKIDIPCPACPYRKGDVRFKQGRGNARALAKDTRLKGRASPEWFECARRNATLSLRIFAGDDHRELMKALRPVYVIDGLEKKFKKQGKEYTFDIAPPLAPLCKKLRGKHTRLLWELWGRGELMQINGGGRSSLELKCP